MHVLIGECGRVAVKTLFVVSACENMMRDMHWKLNRPSMDVDLQGRLDSKVIGRRHAPSVKFRCEIGVNLVAKRQGERWGKKYVYKGSELSATEVLSAPFFRTVVSERKSPHAAAVACWLIVTGNGIRVRSAQQICEVPWRGTQRAAVRTTHGIRASGPPRITTPIVSCGSSAATMW